MSTNTNSSSWTPPDLRADVFGDTGEKTTESAERAYNNRGRINQINLAQDTLDALLSQHEDPELARIMGIADLTRELIGDRAHALDMHEGSMTSELKGNLTTALDNLTVLLQRGAATLDNPGLIRQWRDAIPAMTQEDLEEKGPRLMELFRAISYTTGEAES